MTALSIAEAERRMAVNPQVSVVGAADSEAGGQLATVTSLPNAEAGKDAARPEIPRAAGVSRQAWVGGVSRDIAIPPRAGVSRAAVAPGAAATGRGATGRMVVPGRAPAVAPGAISRAIAGPPAPGIPAPRRAASARPAAPARSAARAHAAASARPAASPARPAVSPAPVRLTARGRRVVAGLAAIAAAAAACLLSLALAGGAAAASHGPAREDWPAAQKVVVEPGQTLWSIATAAEPGADTRAVIDQIVAANHLPGDTIEPGQALWVPAR